MADDTYLVIDGQYLRQIHREAMLGFFGVEGELDISEAMDQARAVRAFFYDSLDDALCDVSHNHNLRSVMTTAYHAKYFAYELTKRCASDSMEKLAASDGRRAVDLAPRLRR